MISRWERVPPILATAVWLAGVQSEAALIIAHHLCYHWRSQQIISQPDLVIKLLVQGQKPVMRTSDCLQSLVLGTTCQPHQSSRIYLLWGLRCHGSLTFFFLLPIAGFSAHQGSRRVDILQLFSTNFWSLQLTQSDRVGSASFSLSHGREANTRKIRSTPVPLWPVPPDRCLSLPRTSHKMCQGVYYLSWSEFACKFQLEQNSPMSEVLFSDSRKLYFVLVLWISADRYSVRYRPQHSSV